MFKYTSLWCIFFIYLVQQQELQWTQLEHSRPRHSCKQLQSHMGLPHCSHCWSTMWCRSLLCHQATRRWCQAFSRAKPQKVTNWNQCKQRPLWWRCGGYMSTRWRYFKEKKIVNKNKRKELALSIWWIGGNKCLPFLFFFSMYCWVYVRLMWLTSFIC